MDKFKDIRPYGDDEIRPVVDRLMLDPEFLGSIASFYAPVLSRLLPGVTKQMARRRLAQQLSAVVDVATMQDVIAQYMDKMIHDTTTGISQSGLENLRPDSAYLFISNHRDIAMDPAFVNYMLYHGGHNTLQIAIGDNLLKKPFVTDLMRLNKSFIVNRSAKGREMLKALALLSEYMHFCIAQGENVWIAQREGRAKDGIDVTDPALVKMLALGRRDLPLDESLLELHIVPVAISYEYDPCDVMKADELCQIEKTGSYEKAEDTDIKSIAAGMVGYKGKVHVAFGEELKLRSEEPEPVAEEIDRQIQSNYRLYDSNFLAFDYLKRDGLIPLHEIRGQFEPRDISAASKRFFEKRFRKVPQSLRRHYLFSYANPVLTRYRR